MKLEVISAEELELVHEIEAMATRSSQEKKTQAQEAVQWLVQYGWIMNLAGSAEIDTQACLVTLDAGNRVGGIELFADDQNDGGREPNG